MKNQKPHQSVVSLNAPTQLVPGTFQTNLFSLLDLPRNYSIQFFLSLYICVCFCALISRDVRYILSLGKWRVQLE